MTTTIVVTPDDGQGLNRIKSLLVEADINVATARDCSEVMDVVATLEFLDFILVDVGPLADDSDRPRQLKNLGQQISDLRDALPGVSIIGVDSDPDATTVIHCFRSGAHDFIDLKTDNTATVIEILNRLGADIDAKQLEEDRIEALRATVEDFLRDLVKTERRSIDLEHQLARKETEPGEEALGDLDVDRLPSILILEDDAEVANLLVEELEDRDMLTYAFVTGEDAVQHVQRMAGRGEAIDLALVDAKLPGMNGLEAIKHMRKERPGLAAILMTGYSDTDTAENAADLGVVGYILKPFDDIEALAERIREQAEHNMAVAREQHYLSRFKQRHEKILTRYLQLTSED